MNTTREALHDYINILSNDELNHLCKVLIELSPFDKPLPDEISAIEHTENDEYIDFDDFDWN